MVVLSKEHVVVRLFFVDLIEAEIEHEGRTGVLFLQQGLSAFVFLAENRGAGVSVVSIDDEFVTVESLSVSEYDA